MGTVYLAHDERLERDVAVKRIAVEGDLDARAEREAIAAARLSHPGIVALYEAGRDDDAVYLVSELVRGRTLSELLRAGALSDRDVLRIGITLCDALEHAHARGVIHRDVKPANIICPEHPEEGGGVAKLTDFGIARLADGDALTRTGDIVGTLAYMAPEQSHGKRITGAADAYALALVLYEALAGVNPIRAGNPAATARRVGTRLAPLRRARRDLPGPLCAAIDATVAPDPSARATLDDLRAALASALPDVADEPGAIAGSALEGLTGAGRDRAGVTRGWRQRPAPTDLWPPPGEDALARGRRRRERRAPAPGPLLDPRRPAGADQTAVPERRRSRLGSAPRALAGVSAGALTAVALAALGPEPPLTPAAGAVTAGLLVALLPRLGWLAVAGALLAWLAVPAPGIALLVALAAAPVGVALYRTPAAWSLPALAPALGALSLAGAWPALAGQAARWPARAALGVLGFWWLALAEALTAERLLLGPSPGTEGRSTWESSALDAARDAAWPLLSGGALAVALLWGIAAALLPIVVRGRSAAADVVGAAFWAAALAAGTSVLAEALVAPAPRGLVAGAVLAGAVAVGARAVRGRV